MKQKIFNNHIYNLLNQLVEEHKSLWRIKNMYKKDSKNCKECQKLCNELQKEKEKYIERITEILKKHLN